jgi:hypothetical protein
MTNVNKRILMIALIVTSIGVLMERLDVLYDVTPTFIKNSTAFLAMKAGITFNVPLEERHSNPPVMLNYRDGKNPVTSCIYVSANEYIVDAFPDPPQKRIGLVDPPQSAVVHKDRLSACATYSARDPENGKNSSAEVSLGVHVANRQQWLRWHPLQK